ncbi:MAG TPA: DinB family protein [Thermoanaerobaculia bacterium]|jgi:uncharacterized damage-inducible protein DinB|nr:DinB family protein [Thermoanaerobaculia bacterium]
MPDLPQLSRSLLAYTMWADHEFLEALSRLPPAHLTVATGTSFGSLLGTLAHVLGSEKVWLGRFVGAPLDRYPEVSDWPDLAAVRSGFEELWPEMEFFLASVSEDQLLGEIAWISRGGNSYRRPMWEALVHMSHHSAYHRGQLTTMLRQLGHQPPTTDLIGYFANH